jgi:hypothetical protein
MNRKVLVSLCNVVLVTADFGLLYSPIKSLIVNLITLVIIFSGTIPARRLGQTFIAWFNFQVFIFVLAKD